MAELRLVGSSVVIDFDDYDLQTVEDHVGSVNRDLCALFIKSYVALLFDCPVAYKPLSVAKKFLNELIASNLKDVVVRYATYADAILSTCAYTSEHSITGVFLDEMRDTPIFYEYVHFYKTGDPKYLTYIISFLFFGKKLDYVDPAFEETAFRGWLQTESDLENLVIDNGILDCLNIIVKQLLGPLDDRFLLPKFGSGYVSEGYIDPNDKIDHLVIDPKLYLTFRKQLDNPARGYFLPTIYRVLIHEKVARSIILTSRPKMVPKNMKTARSIVMEPDAYMMFQQEVLRWFKASMQDGLLSSFVNLNDQEPNRRYALDGSYMFNVDTVDLSSASDRVHIDLVRAIFPKKHLLYLLGTRSSRVKLPDGSVVGLKKFAPMGSALCFPVQCVCFTAIALLGYLMHYYGCHTIGDLRRDACYLLDIKAFMLDMMTWQTDTYTSEYHAPRVFGDDIIIDSRVTDDVLPLLRACGLVVNDSKSFFGGQYVRESCGIYAYNGHDITPSLFRVKTFRGPLNAASYASLIEVINNFGDNKLVRVRSILINELKRSLSIEGLPQALSAETNFTTNRDDFGIFTTTEHLPIVYRLNEQLQREEKRVLVLRAIGPKPPTDGMEEYAYTQWQRARIRGGSTEDSFSVPRVRPQLTRVGKGWTPYWR